MKPVSRTAYYCCAVRAPDAGSPTPICGDQYAARLAWKSPRPCDDDTAKLADAGRAGRGTGHAGSAGSRPPSGQESTPYPGQCKEVDVVGGHPERHLVGLKRPRNIFAKKMLDSVYGRLGEVRSRAEAVEYRFEQHFERRGDGVVTKAGKAVSAPLARTIEDAAQPVAV